MKMKNDTKHSMLKKSRNNKGIQTLKVNLLKSIGLFILFISIITSSITCISASNAGSQPVNHSFNIQQGDPVTAGISQANSISNLTEDMTVPVVIVLKDQPAHRISVKVKKEYEKQLNNITISSRRILKQNASPAWSEAELSAKNISEIFLLEQSQLTEQDKSVLIKAGEEIEKKKTEMRREILNQTLPLADKSQLPIIKKIVAANGSIKYSSKVFNAIVADIPASYLDELSKDEAIYKIYFDYRLQASLDVSTYAMGADIWWSGNYTGSGADAAIIDTGIDDSHPDLNVDYAGVFHAMGEIDPYYDDNPASTDDLHGHGTHVAGIVASTDAIYRGSAYGIDKLINAKAGWKAINGYGYMYYSDGMRAVDWAIFGNADGADVISLSFGGGSTNGNSGYEHFFDAISFDLDIPVVIAAGNGGPGSSTVTDPAGAFNVIGVGNIYDRNTVSRTDDTLASSSSRGPTLDGRIKPDISAPGSLIMSANNNWEFPGQPDFVEMSGTSMAAPQITGSILLVMDYKNSNWKPEALKALLLNTADDRGTVGPDNDYGFGYVNLSHAYVHREDIFTGSIDDTPGADAKFFIGINVASGDTSTLVWNRHVDYAGASYPSSYLSVSNLDLYQFNEADGTLIDDSTSGVNNVEQVKSNGNYGSVILKIKSQAFPSGIMLEDYALATEEGFIEVNPPVLNFTFTNPDILESGSNFNVTVNITNNGEVSVHNINVTILLPPGFTIVSGPNPRSIGTIGPGFSNSANWIIKTPSINSSTNYSIEALIETNCYGEAYSTGRANVVKVIADNAHSSIINGTVRDSVTGTGIADATVSANVSMTTTDSTGSYSLLVPEGTYTLNVVKPPEYYANTSVTVEVFSGVTTYQDINLLLKPTGTITGIITNSK